MIKQIYFPKVSEESSDNAMLYLWCFVIFMISFAGYCYWTAKIEAMSNPIEEKDKKPTT